MDKVGEIELTTRVVDDYLSLPRLDRLSVYRTLSISDRMRLDRKIRDRKALEKKKPAKKKTTDGEPSISPLLLAHLRQIIEHGSSLTGVKTQDFIRSQLGEAEALDV